MKPYPLILLLFLTLGARSQLKLTVSAFTNSDCGMNNGTITSFVTGGVPPYEFSLAGMGGFNTGNFTSLKPADYVLAARDANGTVVSQHVIVTSTSIPPTPTFTTKDPSSCDKLDGTVTVNMAGGAPPFQYSLDDVTYQSSNMFTNLAQGTYHMYIKDQFGCRRTAADLFFLVAPDCGYTMRVTGAFPKCGNIGWLSVTDPLPGILPLKYSLDGINYQDSGSFYNLGPGLYTIRVKDAASVVRLFGIDLNYSCAMQLTLTTVAAGCNNAAGSITAVRSRGEGPFEYSLNNGPFQTSNFFDRLQPGTYQVRVRDVKGLTVSMSATVGKNCATPTAAVKDATCGLPNGEIEVTDAGGLLPYLYSIDGSNYQPLNRFVGLRGGTYTVYVKDAAGVITTTGTVIGGQAAPVVSGLATAATCADNDGIINAVNGSGQSPLAYGIFPASYQASPVFPNLASGSYKLNIKDGNGCTDSVDVIVPLKNSLQLTMDSVVTICEGKSASLKVSSNASLFQWASGPGITDVSKQDQTVVPTVTTKYFVTATLGKCTLSETVLVKVNAAPQASAGKDQTICYGEDARLEGAGGGTYNWTPGLYLTDSRSASPVSKKPASTLEYALSVTDANGCASLQPGKVKITVTTPVLFAGHDTSVLINQPLSLHAVDTNNTGFIQYNWQPQTGLSNPGIADPVANLSNSITYKVTAKTASGCEASDNVTIEVYSSADIYVPNAFTPNGDGHNDYARPIPKGIKQLTYFTIYNRWGGIVYRYTPGSKGWDGRLNGLLQDAGTFTWLAEGVDFGGVKIKRYGTIILVR